MQKKHLGHITQEIKLRLKNRLDSSEYWKERFEYFNLHYNHIDEEKFPNYIKSGGVPKGYRGDTKRFEFPSQIIN